MKKTFLLALALAAFAPCRAAEVPAKPKPDAASVVAALAGWDKKLDSLQCVFKQTTVFGDSGMVSKTEGRVHFQKPDNLRVEHTKPVRQIVYTDKKIIWIYKPQDSQAVRTLWADWISQQSGAFSGISDFGSYSTLLEKHGASVSVNEKEKTVELSLKPKKNPKLYTLTLILAEDDLFPKGVRFIVGDTTVDTRFENVERNGKIPSEVFAFTPPQGVAVIDIAPKGK